MTETMKTVTLIGIAAAFVLPWAIVWLWPHRAEPVITPTEASSIEPESSVAPYEPVVFKSNEPSGPPVWLRDDLAWLEGAPSHYERRRMRMRENGGFHTKEEWEALCCEFGMRCARCKRKRRLTKDHIVPVVWGGSDDIDNIQPLCKPCNSSKHDKTVDYRPRRLRGRNE